MVISLKFPKREQKGIKVGDYLKKREAALILPVAMLPMTVKAANVNIDAIMKAFDPLLDLIQGLSYPVAFLTIAAGGLLVTVGQRHKGIELIRYAILGFLLVQFTPGIMKILMQVGYAMRAAQQ